MKRVVFVIDDDVSLLKGLKRLLNVHGFDVEIFESAEDFEARAKFDDGICLLVDINLTGRSGIYLARELAASGVELPIIFITANDNDSIRRSALEAGCIAYLLKPFSGKSLIEAVDQASLSRTPLA